MYVRLFILLFDSNTHLTCFLALINPISNKNNYKHKHYEIFIMSYIKVNFKVLGGFIFN
ncbi:hypothetical protein ymoll0001_4140 [Yersinia mollaretii ATCC 43969]|uniref:Uncharacterized protein n=1 Tax=Yersinia mollaretii (strain ATCC 43969 / DSM 18520 / CIP 103324 / CNY 7263 / WAIP 204) TaxID=349967 RepID=A0ABP2EKD2_YERMW|nr:hypothetical protein ymoll0001_4140 [Yersinia mollaretii ATCC 43969]